MRAKGKNGIDIAREHVEALTMYLARMQGHPLPRYDTELNKSVIARECGFDRQVFRTNARCREILAEADERDRKSSLSALERAEVVREQKAKIDAKQQGLEDETLRLRAEISSLRSELERLKCLSQVIAETGRLP